MSVAAYVVILSAVFSSSNYGHETYQSSISSRHDSLEECEIAGKAFMNAYLIGNYRNYEPERGHMTCTIIENNVLSKTVVLYTKGDSSKVVK